VDRLPQAQLQPARILEILKEYNDMTLEALLAYAHLLAVLTLVVFISSEAALCRAEWMNATVVRRLGRVDLIYGIAAGLVLLTGIARTWWGIKGTPWYWSNGLLHLKLGLFLVVALMSIKPTLMFRRWRRQLQDSGSLPDEVQVRTARRWVMVQAHLIALIPLAAVFLARGFGARP
jgi:putative membrane protein